MFYSVILLLGIMTQASDVADMEKIDIATLISSNRFNKDLYNIRIGNDDVEEDEIVVWSKVIITINNYRVCEK